MEAGAPKRELSGEKAKRIVDAMRESVAARGIAGATFEHVAGAAGVSRGLLHYYFGTKERLLVEVVRSDTELRVSRLEASLAEASTVDHVLDALVANLLDLIENEPGYFGLVFEVSSAGRRNQEIQRELGELFERVRARAAEIFDRKASEGAIGLRFDALSTAGVLFALADGVALQVLSDPERDHSGAIEAGTAAARHLLDR
jgi:AcrR family transcriptional regulator